MNLPRSTYWGDQVRVTARCSRWMKGHTLVLGGHLLLSLFLCYKKEKEVSVVTCTILTEITGKEMILSQYPSGEYETYEQAG